MRKAETLTDLILSIIRDGDYTPIEMRQALTEHGFRYAEKTVQKTLRAMSVDGLLEVTGERGNHHSPVYALAPSTRIPDEPMERIKPAPLGIIPTRRLDPIAWIVATSGVELEAA